jgi:hypothetical protein
MIHTIAKRGKKIIVIICFLSLVLAACSSPEGYSFQKDTEDGTEDDNTQDDGEITLSLTPAEEQAIFLEKHSAALDIDEEAFDYLYSDVFGLNRDAELIMAASDAVDEALADYAALSSKAKALLKSSKIKESFDGLKAVIDPWKEALAVAAIKPFIDNYYRDGSLADPVPVVISGVDFAATPDLFTTLAVATSAKFVSLDLRGCVMDAVFGSNTISQGSTYRIVNLLLPESVTSIADGNGSTGGFAGGGYGTFLYYSALTKISLPGVSYIGNYAFDRTKIVTVELSDKPLVIGQGAFQDATLLAEIDLSHVTSVGIASFFDCNSLPKTQYMPALESMEENSFQYCNFTSVTVPALSELLFHRLCLGPFLSSLTLGDTPPRVVLGSFTFEDPLVIHIPSGTLAVYTEWKAANGLPDLVTFEEDA